MSALKKLTYLYLAFLFLLPFAVQAESFGNVNLVGATSAGINVGQNYKFELTVDEYPPTGFYFEDITDIELFKIEQTNLFSNNPQLVIGVSGLSSADKDVKRRFENSSAVVVSSPDVKSVQIYAVVKYTTKAGIPKIFNTAYSDPYQIAGGIVTPPANSAAQNNGNLVLPPPPASGTAVTIPPKTNQKTSGDLSAFIFGPTCNQANINLVSCYANKIIRLFIIIASIGSILMIIWGGILLITSAGDTKKVATGRMAVTGAIIGLIIVLLSYSIQLFIEKRVTGTTGSGSGINAESILGPPINIPAPSRETTGQPTTGGSGETINQNVKRVLCVYLGPGDYRQYIYTCYENWDKARSKLSELDSFLESQQRINKPCDPITSEFNASSLISQNPAVYCANDGSGCSSAEGRGDALVNNICLPQTSGNNPA